MADRVSLKMSFRSLHLPVFVASVIFVHAGLSDSRSPYVHRFSDGHGGWFSDRHHALKIWDGVAQCYSPWFVDPNHAPPGEGYLHLIMWIYTARNWYQPEMPSAARLPYQESSFADQGKSTDLRDARLTVRLRGEIDLKGTNLYLLAQSQTPKTTANLILAAQPIEITEDWSEQTIVLANDPMQWTCLGSRKDLSSLYGCDDLDTALADVNVDLIFVLFPLDIEAACSGVADLHGLKADVDYPVDARKLPRGLIQFESIAIEYPR